MSNIRIAGGRESLLVTPVNLEGQILSGGGGGGGGGGDASAANQTITNTRLGDLTSTAPADDTSSANINGRLQRIAQRITSLIALLPSSLGAKTAALSFPVTLSTDGVASGIATQIGEVQANPTSNTVLARLKAIADTLTTIASNPASSSVTAFSTASITRAANTTAYTGSSASPKMITSTVMTFNGVLRSPALTGHITGARITKTSNNLTNTIFRLFLLDGGLNPTATDTNEYVLNDSEKANRRFIDFSAFISSGSGQAECLVSGLWIPIKSTTTSMRGILTTLAGYTPTSGEVFDIELFITQN